MSDDAQTLDFPVHRIFNRRVYWRMPAGPNLRKLALYDPALAVKVWRVLGGSRFDVIHAHHLEGLLVRCRRVSDMASLSCMTLTRCCRPSCRATDRVSRSGW